MQGYQKASFWFSLLLMVLGGFLMCDCYQLFLLGAAFALPGLAIKNWSYKITALVVVCFALAAAYSQYRYGK